MHVKHSILISVSCQLRKLHCSESRSFRFDVDVLPVNDVCGPNILPKHLDGVWTADWEGLSSTNEPSPSRPVQSFICECCVLDLQLDLFKCKYVPCPAVSYLYYWHR